MKVIIAYLEQYIDSQKSGQVFIEEVCFYHFCSLQTKVSFFHPLHEQNCTFLPSKHVLHFLDTLGLQGVLGASEGINSTSFVGSVCEEQGYRKSYSR